MWQIQRGPDLRGPAAAEAARAGLRALAQLQRRQRLLRDDRGQHRPRVQTGLADAAHRPPPRAGRLPGGLGGQGRADQHEERVPGAGDEHTGQGERVQVRMICFVVLYFFFCSNIFFLAHIHFNCISLFFSGLIQFYLATKGFLWHIKFIVI